MTWKILQSRISNCTNCGISKQCKKTFGSGNRTAKIMIIGGAPGTFVEASGAELQSWIWEAGFKNPEDFFVTNVLKCNTPNNRKPTDDEVMSCIPYLVKQVEAIDPVVIVTVGQLASSVVVAGSLLSMSMKSLRGNFHTWNQILVRCIYSPAYYLYTKDKGIKLQAIADLALAREIVDLEYTPPF
jgi:uracil-DNA glycosylase